MKSPGVNDDLKTSLEIFEILLFIFSVGVFQLTLTIYYIRTLFLLNKA